MKTKIDLTHQVIDMSVKAAPPSMVTGLSVMGVALSDIVVVLTVVYLVIHIG